ncbi:MAG: universal stress protein [Cellvibrionaceae bacterium]
MIKDIIVCSNNLSGREKTIKAAACFSKQNNACLTGLHIMNDAVNRYYAYEHLSEDFMRGVIEEEKNRAATSGKSFAKICSDAECDHNWLSIWESQNPVQYIFYTDIVFVGHDKNDDSLLFDSLDFINHTMLNSGRPLIVIPTEWKGEGIGNNVMLAWNESRESVRAMHESLFLMQQVEKVHVVTVNEGASNNIELATGIEISEYLSRRNINCQLFAEKTDENAATISQVLLAHAEKNNIDLIVMGGYGHSRLREILLGGVTRDMFKNSNIPLFILH